MKINTTWASVLQTSFLTVLLFQNQCNAYIMNGTLIFLLGTPNNNLGPITLASPPWTSCSSQPPNMLVKNLNLLNSPLTFQPLGNGQGPVLPNSTSMRWVGPCGSALLLGLCPWPLLPSRGSSYLKGHTHNGKPTWPQFSEDETREKVVMAGIYDTIGSLNIYSEPMMLDC